MPRLLALVSALLATTAAAAEPFAVAMPLDGGDGVVDVGALNHRPAGSRGFVTVRDGHFALSGSGERIRFLGVALTFAAAFPEPEVGTAMARRLARLGVNCVRIHYIDGGTAGRFGRHSIWDPAHPTAPRLDPAQLDRLDRLFAALKAEGIYANLNLKVARAFGDADGLPPDYCGEGSAKRITKGIDLVDPRLIALQQDYARSLLTHVNPYTGLTYAADPAVMAVELNNENSLVTPNRPVDDAAGWPDGPAAALRAAWSRWLTARYAGETALAAAWAAGGDLGADIPLTGDWKLEAHQGAKAVDEGGGAERRFRIDETRGIGWHVQAARPIGDLAAGARATLVLRARSDRRRPVTFRCEMTVAPWTNRGLDCTVPLGPEWRELRLPFTAVDGGSPARLIARLGAAAGTVEFADVRLLHGHAAPALPATGALAAGTVPVPVAPIGVQRDDWLRFLVDTEREYARGMRAFVRGLGVRAPVACGQASWGPYTGVHREQECDYLDDHQYWDHPDRSFRDPKTLLAHGRPLAGALAGANPIADLARLRVAGMPFSVSEFNHCAPNPNRAEALPILATTGALQDWDALVLHEYGAPPTPLAMVWQPFETGSDPALMAFLPAAALAFRAGAIAPLAAQELRPVARDFAPGALGRPADAAWTATAAAQAMAGARIGLDLGRPAGAPDIGPGWSSPGTARLDGAASAGIFACIGERAVLLAGRLGGRSATAGAVRLDAAPCSRDHAALALAALDGRPLATSRRMLITVMAGTSNTGMRRKADGSGLDDWGTAPVLAEPLEGSLAFPAAEGLRAWPLDAAGRPGAELPLARDGGQARLALEARPRAFWYLIAEAP